MKRSPERETNWIFNIGMITLFVLSILYLALYWWPHNQGRESPLDRYEPATRAFLAKLGFAPKTEASVAKGKSGKAASSVNANAVRNAILSSSEWVNSDELDDVQTSGRTATVLVRGRMTNDETLEATREIFMTVFPEVRNLTQLRVIVRVKARSAAGAGRVIDTIRSDIMMSRRTYDSLNWGSVRARQVPKVADRARVYF